ncbi:MAG: NADH-quinone oxidoreductase subunit NuoF [Synergistaceae bacterium]|nr:NADH-quinone oxidoreductase subunit NuoF [Synergistaceae bacterium]
MKITSRYELDNLREVYDEAVKREPVRILVCAGTGCQASGSLKVWEKMCELAKDMKISVEFAPEFAHPHVHKSGCLGFCEQGPLVRIEPLGVLYTKVKPEDCEEIFDVTVKRGEIVNRLLYKNKITGEECFNQDEIPFYKGQTRVVLRTCGKIDPESIEEAIAAGEYQALAKALFSMSSDEVIKTVLASKLRGRGGGGFTAGKKWQQVASQPEKIRYVVCNGDEGDPGAFMDCSIMEGDPHRMIEGMIIAAYAVGAQEGYIYVRAEYPLAVKRLSNAIRQAEELGLIGENILGSGFSFRLNINRGAGAFVCGEGSALTASIEGKRGMPRVKPPRTVEQGLFGKPTVLNNVETYANVPEIILRGSDWYKSIGTTDSPGTKTFALTGAVRNTGLVEVPFGITPREIIFNIGGGIRDDKKFKAVQIGGPSGGCLTESQLDEPLDFDSVKKLGVIVGSGGLVVMDESTCMVEVARFFMEFTHRESCGKCVPCREGTLRMLEILERIVAGKGKMDDIENLKTLADLIINTALCGLGKSAPLPVVSTLNSFLDEYIEHIENKKCPAHVCKNLKQYVIKPEKCRSCSKCARGCPVQAIEGKPKVPYKINQSKCIKCGACVEACPFKAISGE